MKRLTIPFLFVCYFLTLYNVEQNIETIVCIDPGHGGMDSGTSVDGIKESDIVLNISFYSTEKKILYISSGEWGRVCTFFSFKKF